jgi:hypothetical protein
MAVQTPSVPRESSFARRPRQGLVDVARIHWLTYEGAALDSALSGQAEHGLTKPARCALFKRGGQLLGYRRSVRGFAGKRLLHKRLMPLGLMASSRGMRRAMD